MVTDAEVEYMQRIGDLEEENRRLREACRAAANCDHTHTPDVLALLEEALKGE